MGADVQIRVLPDHIANKIAAGEVVERPASVLKELLENAIDAGATRVDAEIVAGGRKLIAVSDNGVGMRRDDALLCVERHATSKIRDVEDIERIQTLGFRGEALAAIASVARFRLVTSAGEEGDGTEVVISGGKMEAARAVGAPRGTRVEVRDLFFNVPARRKFLRSHETELFHLRTVFILQALAHPSVAMSLKADGREVYALGAGDLLERVRDIFGTEYADRLRVVNYGGGTATISGYIGAPSFNRADRSEQYVFVNGRPTSAPLVGYAIREAYHNLLPRNRHACALLFIDTDAEQVDVNVHPTKKEVRFRRPGQVRDALIAGIRAALGAPAAGTSAPGVDDAEAGAQPPAPAGTQLEIVDLPPARSFRYPRRPIQDFAAPAESVVGPFDNREAASSPATPAPAIHNPKPEIQNSSPWSWCRVVGQLGGLYVVLETEDGYVLMDPHAGHERVLFEKFMTDVEKAAVPSQALLLPQTVELSPGDAQRVRRNLDLFRRMGFGISEFGGDAFVVDAMPSYFSHTGAAAILGELASSAEDAGSRGRGAWQEEAVARAACRSAVKARDRLTLQEIEGLVVELARAQMPYTCPHGRPTLVFTSFRELAKRFGRE